VRTPVNSGFGTSSYFNFGALARAAASESNFTCDRRVACEVFVVLAQIIYERVLPSLLNKLLVTGTRGSHRDMNDRFAVMLRHFDSGVRGWSSRRR